MKSARRWGFAGLCFAAVAATTAPPAANPAWEKLKTLVGDWKGGYSGPEGSHQVRISYKLVSGGTGLMETMNSGHEADMITIYHLDGARILATHYCSAGNQPRMAAGGLSPDGKTLTFRFVDATNVGADSEVMQGLVVTFEGPDRFAQAWTSRANTRGRDQVGSFAYTRVASAQGDAR